MRASMNRFFMYIFHKSQIYGVFFLIAFSSMSSASDYEEAGDKKGHWSFEEDFRLKNFVREHLKASNTEINIDEILKQCKIPRRSKKQICEHWKQKLDPKINHEKFSAEETEILLRLHNEFGNRWAEIKREFPLNNGLHRTENQLKNTVHSMKAKRAREIHLRLKRKRDNENCDDINIWVIPQFGEIKPQIQNKNEIDFEVPCGHIKCPHCHYQLVENKVDQTWGRLPTFDELLRSLPD